MRIIGLDFGDKTIGVAVSDPLGFTAQGLEIIRRKDSANLKGSIIRLGEIIREYNVSKIALGFPKNMNNTQGTRCEKTLEFKKRLEREFKDIPVFLVDERLSTVSAEKFLIGADVSRQARGCVIDKIAAVFLLQTHLDKLYFEKNKNLKNEAIKIKDYNDNNPEINENELDEDMDDLNTVTIIDEEGNEIEFVIIDELKHNGNTYLLVVESDKIDDDDADAVIFKETGESEDSNDFIYEDLSDEEFEEVAKLFDERLEDYDVEI